MTSVRRTTSAQNKPKLNVTKTEKLPTKKNIPVKKIQNTGSKKTLKDDISDSDEASYESIDIDYLNNSSNIIVETDSSSDHDCGIEQQIIPKKNRERGH